MLFMTINECYKQLLDAYIYITLKHLPDAFVQSGLQCIQSKQTYPWNQTHGITVVNCECIITQFHIYAQKRLIQIHENGRTIDILYKY